MVKNKQNNLQIDEQIYVLEQMRKIETNVHREYSTRWRRSKKMRSK